MATARRAEIGVISKRWAGRLITIDVKRVEIIEV